MGRPRLGENVAVTPTAVVEIIWSGTAAFRDGEGPAVRKLKGSRARVALI